MAKKTTKSDLDTGDQDTVLDGADARPEVTSADADKLADAVEESVTDAPKDDADAAPEADSPIEDAEVVDETPAAGEGTDFVLLDEPASEDDATDDTAQTTEDEDDHSAIATTPPPLGPPPSEPVVIRKGGFVPLVLGGVLAAVIGFAAARYVLPEGWPWPGADSGFEQEISATLKTQGDEIAALRAELGKAPDMGAALAPVEKRLGDIGAQIDDLGKLSAAASERMDALEARLGALEKAPVTGAADPATVAAYERELKALQQAMATQRGEIEDMLKQAQEKDAAAQAAALLAQQRAALAGVLGALDSGAPYADALAVLEQTGVAIPAGLSAGAEAGVTSRAQLAAAFPEAARAALHAARKDEKGGGFAAFLDRQLGTRSLEPVEGDGPDAVLSRAEAAVNEGRLSDALDLIANLPQPAQDAMQGWLSDAKTRLAALTGAADLTAKLNAN